MFVLLAATVYIARASVHGAGGQAAAAAPGAKTGGGGGVVEGVVLKGTGEPLAKALVYAAGGPDDGQGRRRRRAALTDESGRFTLSGLPAGEYQIRAVKEEEGYPDMTFNFYSSASQEGKWPRVSVLGDQPVRGLVLGVGDPQTGRLVVHVFDARSKQPIRDAQVEMNHKGKPLTLFRAGANQPDGSFRLLIPASVAVNVAVTAPGYGTWRYVEGGPAGRGDSVLLGPGAEKRITVELQPAGR